MNTENMPYKLNVFIEDTDATGFVYHANYLKYLERARAMLLYHKGISHAQLIQQKNLMFIVKSCEIEYKRPAYFEDELNVYTDIEEVVGARVKLKQSIVRGAELLVKANITLACVTVEGRPIRLPPFVVTVLKK
jgi:acyl-CoA thioester hydrolase